MRFIALGDWGVTVPNKDTTMKQRQHMVANAMDKWAAAEGLDFIVTVGDNFYPRGIDSVNSDRFRLTWTEVYNRPSLRGVPWYIANGNHDYKRLKPPTLDYEFNLLKRNELNQTWIFPNLWHSFIHEAGDCSVHVIIIDSTALFARINHPNSQHAWLERELATSSAEWKILVAHHPVYCVGKMGPIVPPSVELLLPLIYRWNVDVYLSGHDHDLEHLRNTSMRNTDFIVSGGGGKETYNLVPGNKAKLAQRGVQTRFFSSNNGFVIFDITDGNMKVDFINHNAETLYSFKRIKH